jgi:hypothetical protein
MFRVRLHRIAAIAAIFGMISAAAAGDLFMTGIDDLPLMPGLVEDQDAGMVFDKPDGRIVEAVAVGNKSEDAVREFYARTLPQLGWRRLEDNVFQREQEQLSLAFERDGADIVVRFSIRPR